MFPLPATLRGAAIAATLLASTAAATAFGSYDNGFGSRERFFRGDGYAEPRAPHAREVRQASPDGAEHFDGRRIIVVDGDTIALPCSVPGPGCSEKVRFRDIDAPESYKPRCEAELRAGLAAKERVAQLLRGGGRVSLIRTGTDVYGRTLGLVMVDGVDVGKVLLREGLALPYSPDRRHREARLAHWCGRGY